MDGKNVRGRFVNGVYYPAQGVNAAFGGAVQNGMQQRFEEEPHPHGGEGYCGGTEGHSVYPFGSAGAPNGNAWTAPSGEGTQGTEGRRSAQPRTVRSDGGKPSGREPKRIGGAVSTEPRREMPKRTARISTSELRNGFRTSVIIGEPVCRRNGMKRFGARDKSS